MSLFGRVKKAAQAFNKDSHKDITTPWSRKGEEAMLAEIMSELESGNKRQGVWAKAVMDSDGDEGKADSLYIKYAMQSLADDYTIEQEKIREKRLEEEESARRGRGYIIIIIIVAAFLFYVQNY